MSILLIPKLIFDIICTCIAQFHIYLLMKIFTNLGYKNVINDFMQNEFTRNRDFLASVY